MDRRREVVGGALCASRRPGLARSADLACSAARQNWCGALLTPVYAARSHRLADARQVGRIPLRTGDPVCPHAPRLR